MCSIKPLLVIAFDGEEEIIYENQVASVRKGIKSRKNALIELSSGREIEVIRPSFEEWFNDWLKRKR